MSLNAYFVAYWSQVTYPNDLKNYCPISPFTYNMQAAGEGAAEETNSSTLRTVPPDKAGFRPQGNCYDQILPLMMKRNRNAKQWWLSRICHQPALWHSLILYKELLQKLSNVLQGSQTIQLKTVFTECQFQVYLGSRMSKGGAWWEPKMMKPKEFSWSDGFPPGLVLTLSLF